MAAIDVQTITKSGVVITDEAAAAGGDTFINNGRTYYNVRNGSGGSITVTFASLSDCNQGFTHDVAVSVADGTAKSIGPFDVSRFNNSSNQVSVTYSGVTSVYVAAVSI